MACTSTRIKSKRIVFNVIKNISNNHKNDSFLAFGSCRIDIPKWNSKFDWKNTKPFKDQLNVHYFFFDNKYLYKNIKIYKKWYQINLSRARRTHNDELVTKRQIMVAEMLSSYYYVAPIIAAPARDNRSGLAASSVRRRRRVVAYAGSFTLPLSSGDGLARCVNCTSPSIKKGWRSAGRWQRRFFLYLEMVYLNTKLIQDS